ANTAACERAEVCPVATARKWKPGSCGVCNHADRARIECGIVYGTPVRILAARFGLSFHSVWRHKQKHLRPAMRAAILAQRPSTEIDLEAQNLKLTAQLLGQLTQHVSVEHRNVLVSESYIELRAAILAAVKPFPEASRAIGRALHELEVRAAERIARDA